ncbi:MAG: tetratricopeptide repeat protein [Acidobacteriota bacterium]|nr:tetratricopeptide repeat protein [Acidobacteriota bacterium]
MRFVTAIALWFVPFATAADTVAVLPLFNHSQISSLDWIGESAAETIRESLSSEGILALAREDRVEVFRRLSIRSNARLTKASVIKVGESLDAGQVIFGEYEVTGVGGDREIRLTARMVNLKKFREGPEFEQAGPLEDLSMLETRMAWNFVHVLGPKAAETEAGFLTLRSPVRIDAVELYIRGLLSNSGEQKQRLFTKAATLDERFSQPAFQLGRMYWERKDWKASERWLERVTRADSHYLEALFLTGLCRYYQGDFFEAIKQFQAVLTELPLNEVYNNLGAAQSRKGLAGADENLKKALEGDEADPDYWFNTGYWEWKTSNYFAAADRFRAVLDRSPGDTEAMAFLGRCLRKEGQRPGDKTEGRERVKTTFEETAFRQLQAEMAPKK